MFTMMKRMCKSYFKNISKSETITLNWLKCGMFIVFKLCTKKPIEQKVIFIVILKGSPSHNGGVPFLLKVNILYSLYKSLTRGENQFPTIHHASYLRGHGCPFVNPSITIAWLCCCSYLGIEFDCIFLLKLDIFDLYLMWL